MSIEDVRAEVSQASKIADAICLDVCELPDRTSPDDWPEAMLVTADELHAIVMARLAALALPAPVREEGV